MDRTFVVPSWEMTAEVRDPVTDVTQSSSAAQPILTVTPFAMLAAVRFVTVTAENV